MEDVLGLVVVAATALLAIGAERQKRIDLERRHDALAKESRERLSAVEARTVALEIADARTASTVEALVKATERVESKVDGLADLLGNVASSLAMERRR